VPTLILGYEFQWTQRTNLNFQAYGSKSTYTERTTDLKELNGNKYQLTLGFRHRRDEVLWSFAVTEPFATSQSPSSSANCSDGRRPVKKPNSS
jgi:hypothetical protein